MNLPTTMLKTYLHDSGWRTHTCNSCGTEALKKTTEVCLNATCPQAGFIPRTTFMSLAEAAGKFDGILEHSHTKLSPAPIVHPTYSSLFASAGVNAVHETIFSETADEYRRVYVIQPVIRTQFFDAVSSKGSSTSFVNPSFMQLTASPDDHIYGIERLFDCLSGLGIYVGNMALSLSERTSQWGISPHRKLQLDVHYRGLQIADAIYTSEFPQSTRDSLSMSDIGIGLERAVWLVNGSPSYFDAIGPHAHALTHAPELLDGVRTMTLMALGGVTPGRTNQGYQFRRLAKRTASLLTVPDVRKLAEHYSRQWQTYGPSTVSDADAIATVESEVDKQFANALAAETGFTKQTPDENTETFLQRLLLRGST